MITVVFTFLFYLIGLHSVSKKFTRSSSSIHKMVEQKGLPNCDIELTEVESLSIGWPRDVVRIGLVLLIVMMFAVRFWHFYSLNKQFSWNGNFNEAIIDSFSIAAFLIALPILGWTPWQWGAVTIDVKTLRIPRIRRTLAFDRGSTRIEVVRGLGGSYFHCAAIDRTQSARFYTNARGVARLHAWSLPEDGGVG